MADAMIRVPAHVRDRLAVLAEAQGTSIRSLIQRFAESTLTQAERDEKVAAAKVYVAQHFGVTVTDEDLAEMDRMLDTTRAQQSKRSGAGATEPARETEEAEEDEAA